MLVAKPTRAGQHGVSVRLIGNWLGLQISKSDDKQVNANGEYYHPMKPQMEQRFLQPSAFFDTAFAYHSAHFLLILDFAWRRVMIIANEINGRRWVMITDNDFHDLGNRCSIHLSYGGGHRENTSPAANGKRNTRPGGGGASQNHFPLPACALTCRHVHSR